MREERASRFLNVKPVGVLRMMWPALMVTVCIADKRLIPYSLANFGQIPAVFGIIVFASLFCTLIYRKAFNIPFSSLERPLYLFLFICACSVLLSVNAPTSQYKGEVLWEKGIKQFLQIGVSAFFFIAVPFFVRCWQDFDKSVNCLVVPSVWICGFCGLIEFIHFYTPNGLTGLLGNVFHDPLWAGTNILYAPFGFLVAPADVNNPIFPRLRGSFSEPASMANFLLVIWPILAVMISRARGKKRSFLIATLIMSQLLMLMTFSAGAMPVLLVQYMMFILFALSGVARLRFLAVSVSVLGVLLLTPVRDNLAALTGRFDTLIAGKVSSEGLEAIKNGDSEVDGSILARATEVSTAFNTFLSAPTTGVGFGNAVFYQERDLPDWVRSVPIVVKKIDERKDPLSVTNMYVRLLAEIGLVGTGVFVVWHLRLMRVGLSVRRSLSDPGKRLLLAGFLISLLGQMLHYMTTSAIHNRYWFLTMGLFVAAIRLSRSETRGELYG